MADKGLMYVVSGAKIVCNMGLRESKLVLESDHGIFIRKKPQMTVEDCLVDTNVIPFGGCVSMENPSTQREMENRGLEVGNVTSSNASIEGIFCGGDMGTATALCAGKCTPIIISSSWENGKEDTEIDEKQALLGRGTLTCLYGGIITIEDTGQE